MRATLGVFFLLCLLLEMAGSYIFTTTITQTRSSRSRSPYTTLSSSLLALSPYNKLSDIPVGEKVNNNQNQNKNRLRNQMKKYTKEQDEIIANLRNLGMGWASIAKELGVTYTGGGVHGRYQNVIEPAILHESSTTASHDGVESQSHIGSNSSSSSSSSIGRSKRRLRSGPGCFTEADDEVIVRLRSAGEGWATIGRSLGKGPTRVRERFLNTLSPYLTHSGAFVKEEDDDIVGMVNKGKSFSFIGTILGRSQASIRH